MSRMSDNQPRGRAAADTGSRNTSKGKSHVFIFETFQCRKIKVTTAIALGVRTAVREFWSTPLRFEVLYPRPNATFPNTKHERP